MHIIDKKKKKIEVRVKYHVKAKCERKNKYDFYLYSILVPVFCSIQVVKKQQIIINLKNVLNRFSLK